MSLNRNLNGKLTNLILSKLEDESLLYLTKTYPSMQNIIDMEWRNRLLSNDSYLSTLEFFLKEKLTKSAIIQSTLIEIENKFNWKITVIYNYILGTILSVTVKIGNIKKKSLLFSWLDVVTHKKLKREVSSTDEKSNLTETVDPDTIRNVRNLLLKNNTVTVEICKLTALLTAFKSFPLESSLDGGEDYLFFPSQINNINLPLPSGNENITSERFLFSIPVEYSSDVLLYMEALNY